MMNGADGPSFASLCSQLAQDVRGHAVTHLASICEHCDPQQHDLPPTPGRPNPYLQMFKTCPHSIFDGIDAEAAVVLLQQFPVQCRKIPSLNRCVGALFGNCVGDSVGAPLEFLPVGLPNSGLEWKRDEATLQLLPHYHHACVGFGEPDEHSHTHTIEAELGRFGLRLGQWSDDASMALCLADSLICNGRHNLNAVDLRVRFWKWWNTGYNNAFPFTGKEEMERECGDLEVPEWAQGDEQLSMTMKLDAYKKQNPRGLPRASIGLGGNIGDSLDFEASTEITAIYRCSNSSRNDDSGNGSVMRLSSIPIFLHKSPVEDAMAWAATHSFTTHPGPLAAECCAFWAFLTWHAINRDDQGESIQRFLDRVTQQYLVHPRFTEMPTRLEAAKLEHQQSGIHNQRLLEILATGRGDVGSCQNWNWKDAGFSPLAICERRERHEGGMYNGHRVSRGYFGSYVPDGVAVPLYSLYHTHNFRVAITTAANCLGDADTTAAIGGQLAGAFYGFEGIMHDDLGTPVVVDAIRNVWDKARDSILLRALLLWAD